MIRFVHTADVQLGMRARAATAAGARLREARFATLESLIALAVEEAVDFVVIAGDLFEDHQVNTRTLARAVQILQRAAPIPVFILPGNHDPLDGSSLYHRPEFQPAQAGNVTVLREAEALRFNDHCVLYSCPCFTRWSMADPTAWIPERAEDGLIRIGFAHGGLSILGHEVEHPIDPNVCRRTGLDYLALGDWHGLRIGVDGRLAYPGTPEQTNFGEERTGSVLLVTVPAPGAPPQIEPRAVHTLHWQDWTRPLADPVDAALQALRDEVVQLPDSAQMLLRLTLTGEVSTEALPLVEEFATWLQARCDNGDLLYAECRPELRSTQALAGALATLTEQDPVAAGVLDDLRTLAGDNAAEARPLEALLHSWNATDPPATLTASATAREALALLARLSLEVTR